MADPITLVAASAAIGGVAGKVAEKAWDSGERWLKERFGTHAETAQEKARENAARFVHQLALRVAILEEAESSRIQPSEIETNPQFSSLLQKTILNAALTSDNEKSELLADLIATRMEIEHETTFSLSSELASDAISRSTRSQLKTLAVITLIEEIRPLRPLPDADMFMEWLDVQFSPFSDFEFKKIDAKHLVAIACASFDRGSGRNLKLALMFKAQTEQLKDLHKRDFDEIRNLQSVQVAWDYGLAGVELTSVGSIVGGLALGQIKGVRIGLPHWS